MSGFSELFPSREGLDLILQKKKPPPAGMSSRGEPVPPELQRTDQTPEEYKQKLAEEGPPGLQQDQRQYPPVEGMGTQPTPAYQWPAPDFIPYLVSVAPRDGNRQSEEKWLQAVKMSLDEYFKQVDVGYLQHSAAHGELGQYMAEQNFEAAGMDRMAQLGVVQKALNWTDTRTPDQERDFTRVITPFLQDQNEAVRQEAQKTVTYRQDRKYLMSMLQAHIGSLGKTARRLVETEANRSFLRGPALGALYGTAFQSAGTPEERVHAEVLKEMEGAAAAFKRERASLPSREMLDKMNAFNPEAVRTLLRASSVSDTLSAMKGQDLSESWVEGLTRKAAEFVGLPVAGLAGTAAKGLAKGAASMVKLGKVVDKIPWVFKGAGIGTYIYAAQKADIFPNPQKIEIANLPPEKRQDAENAMAIGNAIIGTVVMPVFHMAELAGKAMGMASGTIGGLLKGTATASSTMAVGGEAVARGMGELASPAYQLLGAMRGWTSDETKDQLDLYFMTHPKMAGALEKMVTGRDPQHPAFTLGEVRTQALKEFGQEMGAGMMFFGLVNAKAVLFPQLVKAEEIVRAKAEVKDLKLPPEVERQLEQHLDGLVPPKTETEKLAARVGPEQAQKLVADEMAAQKAGTRTEEKPGEVVPVRPARGTEKPAEGPEGERARQASQARDDAEFYYRLANQAQGERRAALQDIAEMHRQRAADITEGVEPYGNTMEALKRSVEDRPRRLIEEMQTREGAEEAVAKQLHETGLEQQDVTERARRFDQMAGQALTRAETEAPRLRVDLPAIQVVPSAEPVVEPPARPRGPIVRAAAEPQPDLTGVLQAGDVVETPRAGRVEIRSVGSDLVQGVDQQGRPVTRSPSEILTEGAQIVGKKRPKREAGGKGRKQVEAPEEREARIERLAQEMARREGKEADTLDEQLAKEIADYDAENAATDALYRTKEVAAEPTTPPPGESQIPPEMMAGVRLVGRMAKHDLVAKLADMGEWTGLKPTGDDLVDSFLQTATSRSQFYPQSLKGPDRVAQAVMDHLRLAEGLEVSAETVTGLMGRLNRDLAATDRMNGMQLSRALQAIMDRHADILKGPWAVVTRMMPKGLEALNRIENAIARVQRDFADQLGESGRVLIPGAGHLTMLVKAMRGIWPWSTQAGMNLRFYSMSPQASMGLADDVTRMLKADPSTDARGAFRRSLLRMHVNWGMPEVELGWIGQKMVRSMAAAEQRSMEHLRTMLAKGGLLDGLNETQRREIFDYADGDPAEWAKITDPIVKDRVPRVRALNEHMGRVLHDVDPTTNLLRDRVRIAREQLTRAEEALATLGDRDAKLAEEGKPVDPAKTKRMVALAKRAIGAAKIKLMSEERQLATWSDKFLRKNFVHHVRDLNNVDMNKYAILRPRTGALEASGELVHDVVASMVDYGPRAIAVAHKNQVLSETFPFLFGKRRLVEWKDLVTPDNSKHHAWRDRTVHVVGEVYVTKKGRRTAMSPTRVKQGDTYVPVDAPPGARRMIAVADWEDRALFGEWHATEKDGEKVWTRTGSAPFRPAVTMNMLNERLNQPGNTAVSLLYPTQAMMEMTVRDGGWFDRATRPAQATMDAALTRFRTGMSELRLKPALSEALLAKLGRFSSKSKMSGLGSPLNVYLSAKLMSAESMNPAMMAWASTEMPLYFMRRLRGATGDVFPLAEVGTPEFDAPRGGMFTPPAKMAKMAKRLSPERLAAVRIRDEAFANMAGTEMFEQSWINIERDLGKIVPKGGGPVSVEAMRRAVNRRGVWGTLLSGVRTADAAARVENYLGVYRPLRELGMSRLDAHNEAMVSVTANHGIFNVMSANPLLGSWFGQWLLGLKTYTARQMFVMLAGGPQYMIRYASLAAATNYLWRQLGLGDLTSAIGSNFYDIPVLGQILEQALLGGDKPVGGWMGAAGFFALPTPFGRSPMMTALQTAYRSINELSKGNVSAGFNDALRATHEAFSPAILDSVARMMAVPTEGGFTPIPLYRRAIGDDRSSYTLKHTGVVQGLLEIVAGTQMEVQLQQERTRQSQAQSARTEGLRADINAEIKGMVRRHDEASSAGILTPEQRAAENEQWKALVPRAQALGINLADKNVKKSKLSEARENVAIDRLPPALRHIVHGGSKEDRVRQLAAALEKGDITEKQLGMIKGAISKSHSLMDWARDTSAVSPPTYERFVKAARKWKANQAQPQR